MNSVNIIGRLTRDPELRKTANGTSVTNFCLAVNRAKEAADFIDCVAWKQTAELAEKYLSKGSKIGVTGRIQTRSYEDSYGKKKKTVEVVVEQMQFLDAAEKKQEAVYPYQEPPQVPPQPKYHQDTFKVGRGGNFVSDDYIDLQDEDMPF